MLFKFLRQPPPFESYRHNITIVNTILACCLRLPFPFNPLATPLMNRLLFILLTGQDRAVITLSVATFSASLMGIFRKP